MLHQESSFSTHVDVFNDNARNTCLSVIAYKSVATSPPSDGALQQLLIDSQRRNSAEKVSGVLVYERGFYFQWIEGPAESLQRLWGSIQRDPRHHHVTLLRDEPVSSRVFDGWDLRLAQGGNVSIVATVAAMESSSADLKRVIGPHRSISDVSWDDLFATIVIPRMLEVHGRNSHGVKPFASTAAIWHADPDSGDRLAAALISPRAAESIGFVDSLLDSGAGFNALYQEVFEPAQLQLGKLWDRDLCDDFYLAIGLARLQLEVRRVSTAIPTEHLQKPSHNVLLSTQPSEPHHVGLIMSSEVFERRGWDVMCQFPNDDQALIDLLHAQWFDVLKLSQSGSLRRDGRLESIRDTIDSARAASLNPSLVVIVDGRTFAERPQVYRAVHANAACVSALDAASMAERLLELSRSVAPLCLGVA